MTGTKVPLGDRLPSTADDMPRITSLVARLEGAISFRSAIVLDHNDARLILAWLEEAAAHMKCSR